MRLSMWMLKKWLGKYRPEAEIHSGGRHIQNVRLFSEDLVYSAATVYLNPLDNDKVLCTNEMDILTLHTEDINEVLNSILDAFEYYTDREDEMEKMIQDGCSADELLQKICDISHRCIVIADAAFYMKLIRYPEKPLHLRRSDAKVLDSHLLPLTSLLELNSDPKIRMKNVSTYPVKLEHIGTALISNLFLRDSHKGWMISIGEKDSFDQEELDLQDAIFPIFCKWMEKNESLQVHTEKAAVFEDILDGKITRDNEYEAYGRLQPFAWHPDDLKKAYVIRSLFTDCNTGYAIEHYLMRLSEASFYFQNKEGKNIYLVNLTLISDNLFEEQFRQIIRAGNCVAGESPVFQDIFRLSDYLKAASIASQYAPDEAGMVLPFQHAVLPYAFNLLKEKSAADLSHPALQQLNLYDNSHHTELYDSLRFFLENNCNYTETARKLYIHRSTLLYRIERIIQMTGIELDNPEERFHLLFSYYLLQ